MSSPENPEGPGRFARMYDLVLNAISAIVLAGLFTWNIVSYARLGLSDGRYLLLVVLNGAAAGLLIFACVNSVGWIGSRAPRDQEPRSSARGDTVEPDDRHGELGELYTRVVNWISAAVAVGLTAAVIATCVRLSIADPHYVSLLATMLVLTGVCAYTYAREH